MLFLVAVLGCSTGSSSDGGGSPQAGEPSAVTVIVMVSGEDGFPVETASFTSVRVAPDGAAQSTPPRRADLNGSLRVADVTDPVPIVVQAPGFIPEPFVVDRSMSGSPVPLTLRLRRGPLGERRIVLHFGGDAMLGRRYLEPTSPDTAVVTRGDGGTGARAVVARFAPLFRAADVRSLNLETVVGELPLAAAYPKKRFLLQSPPETLHALDELGVSIVTLGNNHARDWLDEGVESTIAYLDGAGIPHTGAGVTPEAAALPRSIDAAGYRIGFISVTSVTGDFVNDSLPPDGTPAPTPLPPAESWQYELRLFGFAGSVVSIRDALRRIASAWAEIRAAEASGLDPAETVSLWSSATAVYPELQDWAARRGHGGAAPYSRHRVASDIADLRAAGCDLVVVQFHSGFQFVEVKSEFLESAAHDAIDDGADIVVCHHPHVLQGLEWFRGKLIAYSLGNFTFDQDFLSTFPSAVLRVVFEEDRLLEARVLPLLLDRYRPAAAAGPAAREIVRMLDERSLQTFRSERLHGGVRLVESSAAPSSEVARVTLDGSSGLVGRGPGTPEPLDIAANGDGPVRLSGVWLARPRSPGGLAPPGLLLGRDLFRWGGFEDLAADGESRGGTIWAVGNERRKGIVVLEDSPADSRCLHLGRSASSTARVLARPVARVPLPRHRYFVDTGSAAAPIDGEPGYSVRLDARMTGRGSPFIKLDVYNFDDANPTEDPESVLVRVREIPIDVPSDGAWRSLFVEIPLSTFAPAGALEANAVLFYIGLSPVPGASADFYADDVEIIEWRLAEDLPDTWYAMDWARAAAGQGTVQATIEILPGP